MWSLIYFYADVVLQGLTITSQQTFKDGGNHQKRHKNNHYSHCEFKVIVLAQVAQLLA